MFTNPDDQNAVRRETSASAMMRRFAKAAVAAGVLFGAYNLAMPGEQNPKAQAGDANMPAVAVPAENQQAANAETGDVEAFNAEMLLQHLNPAAGQVETASDTVDIVGTLLQSLMNQPERETAGFYQTVIVDDGVEDSFFDLTRQSIKGENGENVGQINDILVNPQSGRAESIIYAVDGPVDEPNPRRASIGYEHVMIQETDGDIQVNVDEAVLGNISEFNYTPEILERYISLKYLRQGHVVDNFDKTVGRIFAVIYRNNRVEQIYIALDRSLATGRDRLFSVEFEEADIRRDQDGFDLHLSEAQTESIAADLYANQTPPPETLAAETQETQQ